MFKDVIRLRCHQVSLTPIQYHDQVVPRSLVRTIHVTPLSKFQTVYFHTQSFIHREIFKVSMKNKINRIASPLWG